MSLRRTWIVALPVVVLAIAGCGGGGGSSSSESTAAGAEEAAGVPSKAELIEQGDAICAEVNAKVGAIEPESPGAIVRLAGPYSKMAKSLKNLDNPTETEGAYGEYLRALSQLAIAENALKLAVERGSPERATVEKGAEGALSDFQLHAGEYGFKDCSEGPSALASGGT
jgi:hypothetical protein